MKNMTKLGLFSIHKIVSEYAESIHNIYRCACCRVEIPNIAAHAVHVPSAFPALWIHTLSIPINITKRLCSASFLSIDEGTLKTQTPIPECRLYWSFLFGVVKQFCRFSIWSETECLGRGGGGRRSERR